MPSTRNRPQRLRRLALALALVASGTTHAATQIRLQPNEASSQDVFVYEFGIPGVFGIPTAARVTNLDSTTLNALAPLPVVPFGNFLGAANTDPLTGMMGESRAHDTKSLIRFDLSFLNLAPTQVQDAWINVYALPGLPPFSDPTAMAPITTELRAATQAWNESTVTWENRPAVGPVHSSATQSGVNQWVRFDVTGLVRDWLMTPARNYGVELSQPDIVMLDGKPIASLYASSAFPDAELHPYLPFQPCPSPERGP